MTPKEVAKRMMDAHSMERVEAEEMMSARFEDMTQTQRRVAATCIAAFYAEIIKRRETS